MYPHFHIVFCFYILVCLHGLHSIKKFQRNYRLCSSIYQGSCLSEVYGFFFYITYTCPTVMPFGSTVGTFLVRLKHLMGLCLFLSVFISAVFDGLPCSLELFSFYLLKIILLNLPIMLNLPLNLTN